MKKSTINKIVKYLCLKKCTKQTAVNQPYVPTKADDICMEIVTLKIKQLNESAEIVNTTTNPMVFFSRYHFILDTLLSLMEYDDSYFKGITIQEQYNKIYNNIEAAVNDMIDRTYEKERENALKLKTIAGQRNRMIKYFNNMETIFDKSNEIWEGNFLPASEKELPHYTGDLYTQANLDKLITLKEKVLNEYN